MGIKLCWNKDKRKAKMSKQKIEYNPTLPYKYANTHVNFLISFI